MTTADTKATPAASDCGCLDHHETSCDCVLEPLVVAVGRRHALHVLNAIASRETVHFNEIQSQLGGLSSSTLASRLQELEAVRLIEQVRESIEPPRYLYRLTQKGEALRQALRKLYRGDGPF